MMLHTIQSKGTKARVHLYMTKNLTMCGQDVLWHWTERMGPPESVTCGNCKRVLPKTSMPDSAL